MDKTKKCNNCKNILPVNMFNKRSNSEDGFRKTCINCCEIEKLKGKSVLQLKKEHIDLNKKYKQYNEWYYNMVKNYKQLEIANTALLKRIAILEKNKGV